MKEGMKKRGLVIFIISIMIFTGFTGVWANTEDSLTTELKENLIPLKTTLAESGLEDLMSLKDILKDKRIVAMGEATHGTAEFFQMKHRMLEFLVKEMGYKAFGIEAEFGGAQVVNDYILGKCGNMGRCLDAMKMWTWHTKEVADMIIWMKEYNESVKDDEKIRFYGFDIQAMDNSLLYVFDYLSEVGSHSTEAYTTNLKDPWINRGDPIKEGKSEEFEEDINKIYGEIIKNKGKYIKNSSIEEYNLILQHIEVIYQYLDYRKYDTSIEGFNKRDGYMAENVNWILDYESKHYENNRIMLWAHNGHISNKEGSYSNKEYRYITMGDNLKKLHGDDYYSVGFDFYQGGFVAKTFPIFNLLGRGRPSKIHIDSTPKGSFNEVILKDTFDAMIFIESTTGAIRFRKGTELPDGNKNVMMNYLLNLIVVMAGLIGVVISIIKITKNSRLRRESKYYNILDKDDESTIYKKGLKESIIKISNYFNSISTVKYSAFITLGITILSVILNKINSIDSYNVFRNSNIMIFIIYTFYLFLMAIAELYIYYIYCL